MNNNILHKLFLTLTLVLLTLGASAQVTVSGNVSDESGEPIIGATVMEALTTNGVVTDFDGNFKIQVKNENATLKISYIGMVAQNIRVGNQRNIKVVLKDESQKINEVVVVGYGHQKKESVVGAISQVSSDDLLNTPTANVTQLLPVRFQVLLQHRYLVLLVPMMLRSTSVVVQPSLATVLHW